jgi:hypothetical protein
VLINLVGTFTNLVDGRTLMQCWINVGGITEGWLTTVDGEIGKDHDGVQVGVGT